MLLFCRQLVKNTQQHDESETPQGAMADPLMVDLSGIPSENKDEDYEEQADATADDEESYSLEGSANTSMALSSSNLDTSLEVCSFFRKYFKSLHVVI